MNSEDIAPKKEFYKSDLSTAVVTPLSSKIEIINTIVPKIPRVRKIKKDKEEALSKNIVKTGKFKGRRKSSRISKICASVKIGQFKNFNPQGFIDFQSAIRKEADEKQQQEDEEAINEEIINSLVDEINENED